MKSDHSDMSVGSVSVFPAKKLIWVLASNSPAAHLRQNARVPKAVIASAKKVAKKSSSIPDISGHLYKYKHLMIRVMSNMRNVVMMNVDPMPMATIP